jgi:hypothetical protein
VIPLDFLGAVGIFAVQNTQTITVRFLNWGLTASVAILTIAVYFAGNAERLERGGLPESVDQTGHRRASFAVVS